MKWIVALVILISLLGGASAQKIFTGEGYSTTQLSFLSAPNSESFEPNVEKYWGTYISGAGNVTPVASNPAATMNVWMNTFPLKFENPLQIKSSTFTASVPTATGISKGEMNSMLLRRDINYRFNVDQSWKYNSADSSFALAEGSGAPSKSAEGQIISQGIITLFNV
ncbi:MAG TPA: hypothetical protein VLB04_05165 [Methanotrichaceae archaeon]|nr:hypothetical protein [Methanotrichaceae archaeon]